MYSQCEEEKHILAAFNGFVGRFLEIGACDGVLVSNTLALIERGWTGVMIEPSPRAFTALQRRHGDNPRLTLLHAAIGLDYGMAPFWEEETIGGYSTTEETNRAKWQKLAAFRQPFHVPLIPIRTVLDTFPGPIDFLNIDTEGTSTDLFLAFPFSEIRPKLVCVEHDERIDECLAFAGSFGYREIDRNPMNLIFLREEIR